MKPLRRSYRLPADAEPAVVMRLMQQTCGARLKHKLHGFPAGQRQAILEYSYCALNRRLDVVLGTVDPLVFVTNAATVYRDAFKLYDPRELNELLRQSEVLSDDDD